MTRQEKEQAIRAHVEYMLKQSHEAMVKKIDRALNSGAINVDAWNPNTYPMILPKCIVVALLEIEASQYDGVGTGYEKMMKAEVRNIRHFI